MTYLEYTSRLVNRLRRKKAETLQWYDERLASKGHLDAAETNLYLEQVNECHSLANLAEQVMQAMLKGFASPYDQID